MVKNRHMHMQTALFRLLRGCAAIFLAVLVLCGPAWAGMSLMDEDSLSDVQGQTGLSMVARVRTSGGNMRLTATGYLDLDGVTINNSNGGFARIGDYDDPATLDIGRAGTSTRMQLTLPNGMNGATELQEVPSIQAATVSWNGVNMGTLQINRIYQNQSRLTAWVHSDGQDLMAELNYDIDEVGTYKGTGRQAWLQHWLFSANNNGNQTNPGRGTGYFTFGPGQIDIYTAALKGTGSIDETARTIMRVSYPVSGSFRLNNGRIGTSASWHDYGPIIMDGMTGGEVTIYMPISASSGQVNFYPDN